MCFRAIGFNKSWEQVGSSYWSQGLWSTCLHVWWINVSWAPSPAPEVLEISPPVDFSGSRTVIYHGKHAEDKRTFCLPKPCWSPVNCNSCQLLKPWFLQASGSLQQLNLDCASASLVAPWPVKYVMRWNHQEYKASGELLHACVCTDVYFGCMYACVRVCARIFMHVCV